MFEGFILAGGHSKRLGLEKPLLELRGESLVKIAARKLNSAGANEITVVCGTKSGLFKPVLKDMMLVDDLRPRLGAAGGILTALEESSSENVFVLACDLPFVTPQLIVLLANRFDQSNYDALVPLQPDGFQQPLCAFYRKSTCSGSLKDLIGDSEFAPSAREFLENINTEFLEYEEIKDLDGSGEFFLNINTPLDLESAREIARRT